MVILKVGNLIPFLLFPFGFLPDQSYQKVSEPRLALEISTFMIKKLTHPHFLRKSAGLSSVNTHESLRGAPAPKQSQ